MVEGTEASAHQRRAENYGKFLRLRPTIRLNACLEQHGIPVPRLEGSDAKTLKSLADKIGTAATLQRRKEMGQHGGEPPKKGKRRRGQPRRCHDSLHTQFCYLTDTLLRDGKAKNTSKGVRLAAIEILDAAIEKLRNKANKLKQKKIIGNNDKQNIRQIEERILEQDSSEYNFEIEKLIKTYRPLVYAYYRRKRDRDGKSVTDVFMESLERHAPK